MKQCYDWDDNLLSFTDINDNAFYLKLKGNKTIVSGKSATGKSLLCDILKNYTDDNNTGLKPYNADNIFIANKDNRDKISAQKKKLIIIDRAEFILTREIIDTINRDRGINRYLIFLRKPLGIELSPNHFAVLKKEGNQITLEYEFDVKGW